MSYIKHYFHDQIVVSGDIENRNFDDLYGVTIIRDGVRVYIDDFIEHNDGALSVCCIVTYPAGVETYSIIPAAEFITEYIRMDSKIIYPEYA